MVRFTEKRTPSTRRLRALWLGLLLSCSGIAVFAQSDVAERYDQNGALLQSYTSLLDALYDASAGETVKLLSDLDISNENSGEAYCAEIITSITLDGGGHTLTVNRFGLKVAPLSNNFANARGASAASPSTYDFDVTIKNITIANTATQVRGRGGRCVVTGGKLGSLTLDGVTLTTDGSPYTQGTLMPLVIGGAQTTAATINVTNSTIATDASGAKGYAITTYNPVNLNISGSTLTALRDINFAEADGSAGSNGSTIAISDASTLTTGNAGSMLYFNDSNIETTITGSSINAGTVAHFGSTTGNVVTLSGTDNTATFTTLTDDANGTMFEVEGGTFNHVVPNAYLAEGYNMTINLEGESGQVELDEALNLTSGSTITFRNGSIKGEVIANGGSLIFDASCGTNDITVTGDEPLNLTTGKFTQNIAEQYLAEHYATNLISGAYVVKPTVQIATVNDLLALAELVNTPNGAATKGNTYELTADIDLAGVAWTPIGNVSAYPGRSFQGTFDGKGHTISNLKCVDNTANYACAALFGSASAATIKNLTLANVDIQSKHWAGGILAYQGDNTTVSIENCHIVGGSIVSTPELIGSAYDNGDKVGAIVGYATNANIVNCSVEDATLQAYRDLGGLAGFISGGEVKGNTVEHVTLTQDNTNGYKYINGSLEDLSYTVGKVVGGRSNSTVIAQANDTEQNTYNVDIADPVVVAKIGTASYPSFSAAVAAAGEDDVVEICKAGTYYLWNVDLSTKNITIKGAVDNVVFDCTYSCYNGQPVTSDTGGAVYIAVVDNGVNFENVTLNLGKVTYRGFDHQGFVQMKDCTLNGLIFTNNDMEFINCTFNAPGTEESGISGKDYSMWTYAGDVTFTNCTFNSAGKVINVYNDGGNHTSMNNGEPWKIIATNCTFNSTYLNKAAFNVKATSGTNALAYEVIIDNCVAEGNNWPAASESTSLVVLNSLIQVDDIKASVPSVTDVVQVTTDPTTGEKTEEVLYTTRVAEYNGTRYDTMEDAVSAITTSPATIKILKDVTLTEPLNIDVAGKSVTLDLNEKTLSGRTNLKGGELTIQNGNVNGGNQQALNVYGSSDASAINYSVLTIANDVNVTADEYGVVLFGKTATTNGYGAVINIAGKVQTTGTGAEGAVFVSGNLGQNVSGDMNNFINITGKVTSDTDAAIALNGNATVNVEEGAEITGNTAIAIKRGTLNVTGGTVAATGEKNYPSTPNYNGTEMTGAAVSMSSTYNQYGDMAVNISGGTFTSANADALYKAEGNYTNDATFAVSGGDFSSIIPASFCVDGKICETTATDGMYGIIDGEYVALIGETGYATMEDALSAITTSPATIKILKDVTLTEPLNIDVAGKSVTLDLNEKTLSGRTNLKGGELTIQNGNVNGGNQQALNVYGSSDASAINYSVLTIANDVNVTADEYGVVLFGKTATTNGYGAVINIAGKVQTTGTGAEGAVFVSGNLGQNVSGDMNNFINITGKVTSDTDAAIALNGNATVNVEEGAEITGNTAIAIKRGTLNVTGGTVAATGEKNYPSTPNYNGTEMTGAAVSMSSTYNQYGDMAVNISGGTFTSANADALYKAEGNYTNDATFAVSGGDFSSIIPASFCVDGKICETTATDGMYGIIDGEYVALIGETGYATLEAAIAAAQPEDIIVLVDDLNYGTSQVNINKAVTIDGQGKTITSTAAQAVQIAPGDFDVTLNNLNIDATQVGLAAGTGENSIYTGELSVKNSTFTVGTRGINLIYVGNPFNLNLDNSTVQLRGINDYNKEYSNEDRRGINPCNFSTSADGRVTLNITNSTIQGFTYDINLPGSGNNIDVTMTGGKTAGRAVFNVWGDNNNLTLDGVKVLGLNNQTGPTENFACIMDNTDAENNVYTIKDVEFSAYLSDAALTTPTSTASEYLFDTRGSNATIKFLGNTTYSSEAEEKVGLMEFEPRLYTKGTTVLFDEDAKESLNEWTDQLTLSEVSNAPVVENMYPLNFTAEAILINDNNQVVNYYATFAEAMNSVANGFMIYLLRPVTLTEDITCSLQEGEQFCIFTNENAITKGDYSVKLNIGVTVQVDQQTDIFSTTSNDERAEIYEQEDPNDVYFYTAVYGEVLIGEEPYATKDLFENVITDGQYDGALITFLRDVTLDSDLTCGLEEGGLLEIVIGEHAFNTNGYTIALADGVTILTDKDVDVFVPAASGSIINKTANVEDGYSYSAQPQGADGIYAFFDGEACADQLPNTDMTAEKVTYTRTFSETNAESYQSWYVPFDYTIKGDEDGTFYKIDFIASTNKTGGDVTDEDAVYIWVQKMSEGETVKGNRPYLFEPNSADTYTFEQESTTIYAKNESSRLNLSKNTSTYDFYGTYDYKQATKGMEWLWMSADGYISWNATSAARIRPYRWYILVTGNDINDGYSQLRIGVIEKDEDAAPTDIADIEEGAAKIEGYYSLDGKKMDCPAKGLNIVRYTNGTSRKLYIK